MKILSVAIRIFKYEPESGKFVSGPAILIHDKDTLENNFSAGATPNEKTTIYQYTKQQRFYD